MLKPALLLLCGLLALPVHAMAGRTPEAPMSATACGMPDVVRLSPNNPNDPLFPPQQWPKCTGSGSILKSSIGNL